MIRVLVVIAALCALLAGCTQMPTEKQNTVDMRPQISFKADRAEVHQARVYLDGLEIGTVGDYLSGQSTFRVLSGVHVLKVQLNGSNLLEEKIYLGDGVNRSVLVK